MFEIPVVKIGTPYQKPSWRFDCLSNPRKYGMESFCSKIVPNAGFMKRLVAKGVSRTSVYKLPNYVLALSKTLPPNLYFILERTWNKHYFKTHKRKITFSPGSKNDTPICWNQRKVEEINDAPLRELISHCFNFRHSTNVDYAIKLFSSADNSEIKRFLGYSFYANIPDKTIAKRWNLTLPLVKTIKNLFFDFSYFPKDRIAAWAVMRQLAESGDIDHIDFQRFKRIFDLGELGIKMIEDFFNLTPEEKEKCEEFLGATSVSNTINLHLSIRTTKDALAYSNVVSNFARISLLKEELRQKDATLRLTELNIQKASKELGNAASGLQAEDQALLEMMRECSKFDTTPQFLAFNDLMSLK